MTEQPRGTVTDAHDAVGFGAYETGLAAGSRTLRIGKAGDDVRQLQRMLGIEDDGLFGRLTEQAVRTYQSERRLDVDGVVGPVTWEALLREHAQGESQDTPLDVDPAQTPASGFEHYVTDIEPADRVLHRGSAGDDVKTVQVALGFTGSDVDGLFGPGTEEAVRRFQAEHGLEPTASVDQDTWPALLGRLAEPEPSDRGSARDDDWSGVDPEQRMRYVMSRLVDVYDYPVDGAAGLVGNLWAESGVLPARLEGSRADSPLRAPDFNGVRRDWTPEQVMNRDRGAQVGPRFPGVGLAQWTSPSRRAGLFRHEYDGVRLGAAVLFDMDAQVDYLHHELHSGYSRVAGVLTAANVSVAEASDEVVYNFEIPGSVLSDGAKLPRSDAAVQAVFEERRRHSRRALRAYTANE